MEIEESKLKKVLDEKGLKLWQFGELMGGLSSQTLNNWVKRGVPNGRTMEVAVKLEVPVSKIAQDAIEVYAEAFDSNIKPKAKNAAEFIEKSLDELKQFSPEELKKLQWSFELLAMQWKKEKEGLEKEKEKDAKQHPVA